MIQCNFITTFPGLIEAVLGESILKRAQANGLLDIRVWDLREFTSNKHRTTDDSPYGGGGGMVMKPEPIFKVIDRINEQSGPVRLVMPTPQGALFTQDTALAFSREKKPLVFICGHYEGIDERVRLGLPVEEVSIGDYVLTGGELAALVIVDAAVRLIPGVLGDFQSAENDSFVNGLLDFPHYTRPPEFRGMRVPEVLLSGDHEAIRSWRKRQTVVNTYRKRPDLISKKELDREERQFLNEMDGDCESR